MNNEKQKVTQKIAKLLALGNTNSNQSESMVAMQKAGDLMREWGLSISDIELKDEKIVHRVIDAEGRQRPNCYHSLMALAEFTNVKLWISRPHKWEKRNFQTNIVGYEQDIELFVHFYNMIENAYKMEYSAYKETDEYAQENEHHHGRVIMASFRTGFFYAISSKLYELARENRNVKTVSGTELVPLKMANVEEYFEEEFNMRLTKSGRTKASANSYSGYASGNRSGNNMNFNSPVGNSSGGATRLLT